MPIPWIYAGLVILSSLGLMLSAIIHHKKQRRNEPLVCPLQFKCNAVVHSPYAQFLGVSNEKLGMVFYGFVALSYLAFLAMPALASGALDGWLLALTLGAFLFSLYLTFLQIFVLRELCSYCLGSALLTAVIFPLTIYVSRVDLLTILTTYKPILLMFHVFGLALGVGGATLTDVFFFRFIKDLRISHAESQVLQTISQAIWFGLGLLVLTGIGLYLPDSARLLASSKFVAKVAIVAVLIINGIALHYFVSPKLVRISFGIKHLHQPGELHRLRKLAYALGAISIVSWYSAFALGMVKSLPFSAPAIVGLYLLCVAFAVIISQYIDLRNSKKAM